MEPENLHVQPVPSDADAHGQDHTENTGQRSSLVDLLS